MLTTEQETRIAAWIEALTNGTYHQAHGRLRVRGSSGVPDAHCCLGVACDLYDPEKWRSYPNAYDHQENTPPNYVCAAFGLAEPCGIFRIDGLSPELALELRAHGAARLFKTHTDHMSLAELNDAGVPFRLLAKVIAARPEGLFGPYSP